MSLPAFVLDVVVKRGWMVCLQQCQNLKLTTSIGKIKGALSCGNPPDQSGIQGKKKKKTFAVQCIICMEITNRSTWCVAALIRLNNSESLFFSHLTDDIIKGETLASER